MIAEHMNPSQLRDMAKEFLNREFLMIRMAAYRMYQGYIAHSHPYQQQLTEIVEEQNELQQQVDRLL